MKRRPTSVLSLLLLLTSGSVLAQEPWGRTRDNDYDPSLDAFYNPATLLRHRPPPDPVITFTSRQDRGVDSSSRDEADRQSLSGAPSDLASLSELAPDTQSNEQFVDWNNAHYGRGPARTRVDPSGYSQQGNGQIILDELGGPIQADLGSSADGETSGLVPVPEGAMLLNTGFQEVPLEQQVSGAEYPTAYSDPQEEFGYGKDINNGRYYSQKVEKFQPIRQVEPPHFGARQGADGTRRSHLVDSSSPLSPSRPNESSRDNSNLNRGRSGMDIVASSDVSMSETNKEQHDSPTQNRDKQPNREKSARLQREPQPSRALSQFRIRQTQPRPQPPVQPPAETETPDDNNPQPAHPLTRRTQDQSQTTLETTGDIHEHGSELGQPPPKPENRRNPPPQPWATEQQGDGRFSQPAHSAHSSPRRRQESPQTASVTTDDTEGRGSGFGQQSVQQQNIRNLGGQLARRPIAPSRSSREPIRHQYTVDTGTQRYQSEPTDYTQGAGLNSRNPIPLHPDQHAENDRSRATSQIQPQSNQDTVDTQTRRYQVRVIDDQQTDRKQERKIPARYERDWEMDGTTGQHDFSKGVPKHRRRPDSADQGYQGAGTQNIGQTYGDDYFRSEISPRRRTVISQQSSFLANRAMQQYRRDRDNTRSNYVDMGTPSQNVPEIAGYGWQEPMRRPQPGYRGPFGSNDDPRLSGDDLPSRPLPPRQKYRSRSQTPLDESNSQGQDFPTDPPRVDQDDDGMKFAMSNIFNPDPNAPRIPVDQRLGWPKDSDTIDWSNSRQDAFSRPSRRNPSVGRPQYPPPSYRQSAGRPLQRRRTVASNILEPALPPSDFDRRFPVFTNDRLDGTQRRSMAGFGMRSAPPPLTSEPGYVPVGKLRRFLYETSKLSGSSHEDSNKDTTTGGGEGDKVEPGYGPPNPEDTNDIDKTVTVGGGGQEAR